MPSIMTTTRLAQASDIPALEELMTQLGYPVSAESLTHAIASIRQQGGEVWVAATGSTVIGCVNAIIDARLAEGVFGEIASLVVRQEYRGTGVGKSLVAHAEKWLGRHVSQVRVRANAKRKDAHGFYTASGYQLLKEQKVFIKRI